MYAIKTEINDPAAPVTPVATAWRFEAQKTMYGGKKLRPGDRLYLFDSENQGGAGLIGWGLVTWVEATPRRPGIERQTPRISLAVSLGGRATRPLGRAELRGFTDWDDGRPETELCFKLYRQATNKVVGLSPAAAAFLAGCCTGAPPASP